jgi:predicted TIM-barrel fold metal-dependent hydrolase
MIDCHVHVCPDSLAERNREIIRKSSGITPAYDGRIDQLLTVMKKSKISKAIINNPVQRPELMPKANDFTAQVVSKNRNTMFGMAWIIPGEHSSVQEVQRCKDLRFKGIKMHNSHFKSLPTDSRNDKIYEKIAECELPVLFHCGLNPFLSSGKTQYAMPENFMGLISSFPDLKIILGHLAGYQDDPAGSIEAINASKNVFADLALGPKSRAELETIINQIDIRKLVFGSDYPIYDALDVLNNLRFLTQTQLKTICHSNPKRIFALP